MEKHARRLQFKNLQGILCLYYIRMGYAWLLFSAELGMPVFDENSVSGIVVVVGTLYSYV